MPTNVAPRRQDATFHDLLARIRATWRRGVVQRVFRRLIGAPDYESYLEHCRRADHLPRLTEREYIREFFENKGKAPRCC